jgi:hypothetical protein
MKVLSEEKIRVLSERHGWSLAYAEGFLNGEAFRRRGTAPSMYARVGIDEYCLGFRAGYFERNRPVLMRSSRPDATARIRMNAGGS